MPRYGDSGSWLKVGDPVELRDDTYGETHWLESRVREVVGADWKPKAVDQLLSETPEQRKAPAESYANYLNCDSDGYVVSAPWTRDGFRFVARKDEGKVWRRARGSLKAVP